MSSVNATAKESGEIFLEWTPARNSTQDSYKVRYNELENYQSDNVQTVTNTSFLFHDLLRGRNYSLSVTAVSRGMESEPYTVYQATRKYSSVPCAIMSKSMMLRRYGRQTLQLKQG